MLEQMFQPQDPLEQELLDDEHELQALVEPEQLQSAKQPTIHHWNGWAIPID